MLMNRKTRPICHGRMGKGNNLCSHMIAHVLAESLLGAVKSKVNCDVMTRLDCHLLLQFQCTKLRINLQKKLEMATGIRPYQYEPVVDINFGINWELVRKKYYENSGGYVCVYCIL